MSDEDFVYQNLDLPADKIDSSGSAEPVANQHRRWVPNDGNRIFSALRGLRTALLANAVNVKRYGAVGDGVADDREAIQEAINGEPGRAIYFPRGTYKVTSTIFIAARTTRLIGDFGARGSINGTEISFTGTGPCIQIGVDEGTAWDANEYDEPQDHILENICIRHAAPDTVLAAAGPLGSMFKLGAYGIWDWGGGGITMHRCVLEHFEANFVGIQSDINAFVDVTSNYSRYGFYLGPRSDQNTIKNLYAIHCDRAITNDRAGGLRIETSHFVGCGHATAAPIEIRRGFGVGSFGTTIDRCWFEHFQGYQGTDQLSFVSVGEIDGYGAGGSIQSPGPSPSTGPAVGCVISSPSVLSLNTGIAGHTRFLASVGKCQQFKLTWPMHQNSGSLTNFDALVGVVASQAPTNVETTILIEAPDTLTDADCFSNLGAGAPALTILKYGANGITLSSNVRMGASTLAAHIISGTIVETLPPNTNGGGMLVQNTTANTTDSTCIRGLHTGTVDTSGGFRQAVAVNASVNATRSAGASSLQCVGLQATAAGGQDNQAIRTISGDVDLNTTAGMTRFNKSVRFNSELVPAQITGNQNDYNPPGFADAHTLLLTSSIAVDLTGFAIAGANGREIRVYNDNAGGGPNITLKHLVTSSAANQIVGRANADTVLAPKTSVILQYSPSKTKWLVMGDSL